MAGREADFSSWEKFLRSFELEQADQDLLEAHPFYLKSIVDFANAIEAESSFRAQVFDKVAVWKDNLSKCSRLKQAWKAAVEHCDDAARAKRAGKDVDMSDDPLKANIRDGLSDTFKKTYSFYPCESWLLGWKWIDRFWRQLHNRRLEVYQVALLPVQSDALPTAARKDTIKLQDVSGKTIELTQANKVKELDERPTGAMNNPLRYILALKHYFYTLAVAGADRIEVERKAEGPEISSAVGGVIKETQLRVRLQDLNPHLARAEAFVIKWSTASPSIPYDHILKHLKRIDEDIRTRWSLTFNHVDKINWSLGQVIESEEQYARFKWDSELTAPAKQVQSPQRPGKGARAGKGAPHGSQPAAASPAKAPPKGAAKGAKGKGKQGELEIKGVRQKIMKSRTLKGENVQYCLDFNRGSCTRDQCRHRHRCCLMVNDNYPCDQNHPACEHKGKSVAA